MAWEEYSPYNFLKRGFVEDLEFFIPNNCLGCPVSRGALQAISAGMPDTHDFRHLHVSSFYDILDAQEYNFACEYQWGEEACRDMTLGV